MCSSCAIQQPRRLNTLNRYVQYSSLTFILSQRELVLGLETRPLLKTGRSAFRTMPIVYDVFETAKSSHRSGGSVGTSFLLPSLFCLGHHRHHHRTSPENQQHCIPVLRFPLHPINLGAYSTPLRWPASYLSSSSHRQWHNITSANIL